MLSYVWQQGNERKRGKTCSWMLVKWSSWCVNYHGVNILLKVGSLQSYKQIVAECHGLCLRELYLTRCHVMPNQLDCLLIVVFIYRPFVKHNYFLLQTFFLSSTLPWFGHYRHALWGFEEPFFTPFDANHQMMNINISRCFYSSWVFLQHRLLIQLHA